MSSLRGRSPAFRKPPFPALPATCRVCLSSDRSLSLAPDLQCRQHCLPRLTPHPHPKPSLPALLNWGQAPGDLFPAQSGVGSSSVVFPSGPLDRMEPLEKAWSSHLKKLHAASRTCDVRRFSRSLVLPILMQSHPPGWLTSPPTKPSPFHGAPG